MPRPTTNINQTPAQPRVKGHHVLRIRFTQPYLGGDDSLDCECGERLVAASGQDMRLIHRDHIKDAGLA
jgi:hypothetical protein